MLLCCEIRFILGGRIDRVTSAVAEDLLNEDESGGLSFGQRGSEEGKNKKKRDHIFI